MFKFTAIFLFFFGVPNFLLGQYCSCDKAERFKKEITKLHQEKNFDGIYRVLNDVEVDGNKKCIGIVYNHLVSLIYFDNEFQKCLDLLKKANAYLNEPCLDSIRAENYFLTGRNYYDLGSMDSSQAYFIRSAELAERIKAFNIQVNALSDICWVFQNFGQQAKALSYLKKALRIALEIKDTNQVGILYSNIAAAYGEAYEATKNSFYLDSTVLALKNGLTLHRIKRNDNSIQFIYVTFANVYLAKKEFKKAFAYCDSVTNMNDIDAANRYLVYSIKSKIYEQTGNKLLALNYADSCYNSSLGIASPYEMVTIMEQQIQCNKNIGNKDMALALMDKLMRFKDSTRTIEVNTKVNELEQKYNKSQNERTIVELNKENELVSLRSKFLVVGIIASILVILIIIFFYRQTILKAKFESLETEQRLNRARMNPHFFFNALTSIQTLSMDKENGGKVSVLISQFSKIMRQALESTYDEITSIEEEIDFLKNYLNIQKARFLDKFDFQIQVGDNIEINELKIPGMLLQPFIENSIEHGFKNLNYKGQIDISITKEVGELKITLCDNGKGFNTDNKIKEYPSRATLIITDRLTLLNKKYKSKSRFEIIKNHTEGVSVIVYLPIIY